MSPRYLLDTDICIYIKKQEPKKVFEKCTQLTVGEIGMSIVTYGELVYGAHKSHYPEKNLSVAQDLINFIPLLPLPIKAAHYYGEVRASLEKQGKIIGNNDLWIAAHALAMDLILVTNNTREFERVPNLKLENWVTEI